MRVGVALGNQLCICPTDFSPSDLSALGLLDLLLELSVLKMKPKGIGQACELAVKIPVTSRCDVN